MARALFLILAITAVAVGLTAEETLPSVSAWLAALGFAWTYWGGRGRVVAFNLASLALLGASYLAWSHETVERIQNFSAAAGLFRPDVAMGHRPDPGLHTTARMMVGDEVIYDTAYTFDADGLRVHPPEAADAPDDCVLFFGCSYTFGEGVGDNEAMPYVVGTLAQGRYRIRNFGFSGYGPHHMLAAIETGLVARVARCKPRFAVYQAHPHHVTRAAGKWWWDERGPRYVQAEDGSVRRSGNFNDPKQSRSLSSSLTHDLIDSLPMLDREQTTPEDIRLAHGIIRQAKEQLTALYPGIEFHVLYWDIGNPHLFGPGWFSEDITVHDLSEVIGSGKGQWPDGWEQDVLLPRDVHPTAATHARIARYVGTSILHLP